MVDALVLGTSGRTSVGVRVPPSHSKSALPTRESIMKVNVEAVSAVEKKLAIEVPWDRVKEELEAAYRGFHKSELNRKAFEREKVPRKVLEKYYGAHGRRSCISSG